MGVIKSVDNFGRIIVFGWGSCYSSSLRLSASGREVILLAGVGHKYLSNGTYQYQRVNLHLPASSPYREVMQSLQKGDSFIFGGTVIELVKKDTSKTNYAHYINCDFIIPIMIANKPVLSAGANIAANIISRSPFGNKDIDDPGFD